MNINIEISKGNTISAFLAGAMVHAVQIGVGMLGFQRVIAKESGHDAWISVVMAGLVTQLTVWVIVKTLQKYRSADLYGIQEDVFGKWLGKSLGVIFIVYFLTAASIVLRNYIEVVQTWVFPELATWLLSGLILFLALYTMLGGIRVIAGYTVFSIAVTFWLICILYFPLQYAQWEFLLPIMDTSFDKLLKGMVAMSLTSIGFEVLYMVYPYVQDKQRVGRSAQWAILATNLLYTFVMIVSLVFFSQGQLMRTIWATLNLKKVVYLPIMERFELVGISLWLLIVLPNITLYLWCAARGAKRVFGCEMRTSLYVFLPVLYIASLMLLTRQEMNWINDLFARSGVYFAYVYPYFLYLAVLIKKRFAGAGEERGASDAKMPN
ncbi:GerAB/ArcD/ProY family transporter [Brevibacillus parabrevis]|uniref:GerAB/ArcD/ProY family transporter n=1 Tax=Brevibacillus parabrevis TaxID=54914 RepID=UPI00113CE2EC|nr:GerAB/ArcD/ProY family transporter [Brevibacillus parabrevis]MED1722373.1 GerAB/ArcD/ProY family transporter [Brevibacillus parabrevis]TGV30832.1 spore gernimation protein [Mesorhizobium sp. M00.F.Ca.ET.186.01.1.1]